MRYEVQICFENCFTYFACFGCRNIFFLYYSNRIPENALVYYRIKDHKGEISVWRASNCEINGAEFHCHAELCPDDKLRGYPLSRKYKPDTNVYQDTAIINLNFGLFKKTSYIPRPVYATFDTAYFKKQFASVKKTFPCSHSKRFSSSYELTAIDLPSGVTFYETGKKKDSPKTAKSKEKNERKDSLSSNLKTAPTIHSVSILCPDFWGGVRFRTIHVIATIIQLIVGILNTQICLHFQNVIFMRWTYCL